MKKYVKLVSATIVIFFAAKTSYSQLITMSNGCYKMVQQGNTQNKNANYDSALATFTKVLSKCDAKDAKEQGNVGKAHALNGLKRYDEAITACQAALKVSKNTSLMAFYERGVAYNKLQRPADSKADFAKVIDLTEKNRNVKQRATIYAQLADLDVQQGTPEDGLNNINKAIALDSMNADFYIQRGDMYVKAGKIETGFKDYDRAVALGRNDMDMYLVRTNARLGAVEKKYGTNNANALAKKMTSDEKQSVCEELRKALGLGLKNINMDMLSALICK